MLCDMLAYYVHLSRIRAWVSDTFVRHSCNGNGPHHRALTDLSSLHPLVFYTLPCSSDRGCGRSKSPNNYNFVIAHRFHCLMLMPLPHEVIQVMKRALLDHVWSLRAKQIIKSIFRKQRTPSCGLSKRGLPCYPLPMLNFGKILVTSVMRIQYQESTFPCSLTMADAKQCVGKNATSNLQACIMTCTT